jgi:hypothetical protein
MGRSVLTSIIYFFLTFSVDEVLRLRAHNLRTAFPQNL